MGRWDKMEKAARENGFVADDEVVQACGVSIGTTIQNADGTHDKDMQRHALIVTDTKMHAIRMGAAGFKSLKEPLFSLPREEVEFVRDGSTLVFNTVDRSRIWSFAASAFGHNFDGVADAMVDRRGRGA
ncbi:MAG TPA: hypothetical protein VFY99_06935 [Solirubrobacterales bacterium]